MEELQVPTRKIEVEIFGLDGERIDGFLFAPESAYHASEPEDLFQILNDDRSFLPVALPGTERDGVILHKRHITRVRPGRSRLARELALDAAEQEGDAEPEPDAGVHALLLADGARIVGVLAVETPRAASRFVDKLNHAPRFFPVHTRDGVEFVNRELTLRAE